MAVVSCYSFGSQNFDPADDGQHVRRRLRFYSWGVLRSPSDRGRARAATRKSQCMDGSQKIHFQSGEK